MARMTIVTFAAACILAASPVLAQSAPTTPAPPAQPVVSTPDAPATTAKPAGQGGCPWKARQVMS